MPTITWTSEHTIWVDGNDVGDVIQELWAGRGPRVHEGAGLPQGPITIHRDPPA